MNVGFGYTFPIKGRCVVGCGQSALERVEKRGEAFRFAINVGKRLDVECENVLAAVDRAGCF